MAKSLMESIRKNLQAGYTPQPQTAGKDLKQAVLAKSGKAVGDTGPRMSSVQQEAAAEQVATAGRQQQIAGESIASGLEQQQRATEQQQAFQVQALDQEAINTADNYTRQAEAIAGNLAREGKSLDTDKKIAGMQQAGFLLGLSNKQYIQELEQAASLKRLQDEASFREELRKSALEESNALYEENLEFQSLIDANERDFQYKLSKMSAKSAYDILKNQATSQERAAAIGAIAGAGESGISSYGKKK